MTFTSFTLLSQSKEIGLSLGGTNYWGDMNLETPTKSLKNMRFGLGILARYNLTNFLSFKGNIHFGKLHGDDRQSNDLDIQQRNLNFYSNVFELTFGAEFNLFGYSHSDRSKSFSPFLYFGGGLLKFNPKTTYDGNVVSLQGLGTEGQGLDGFDQKYKLWTVSIPMGGGIKWKLNDKIILGFDFIWRFTFSDYLDDVSGNYADYDLLLNSGNQLAAYLSDRRDEYQGLEEGQNVNVLGVRGSPDVNDMFFTTMFTVAFVWEKGTKLFGGNKIACPKVN